MSKSDEEHVVKTSEELISSGQESDELPLQQPVTYGTFAKALSEARKYGRKTRVKYVIQTSDSSDDHDKGGQTGLPQLKRRKSRPTTPISLSHTSTSPAEQKAPTETAASIPNTVTGKTVSSSLPARLHTSKNKALITRCSSEPSNSCAPEDPSKTNSGYCVPGHAKRKLLDKSGGKTSHLPSEVDRVYQCELQETHSSVSQNLETITPHRPLVYQPDDMAQEIRKTNELLGELIQQIKKYEQRVEAIEEKLAETVSSCSSASASRSLCKSKKKDIPVCCQGQHM